MYHFSKRTATSFGADTSRRHTRSGAATRERAYLYASQKGTRSSSPSSLEFASVPGPAYDLKRNASMPALFSSSSLSVSSISTPFSRKKKQERKPKQQERSVSSPASLEFHHEIQRTASGGLLGRRQTYQERERTSREKASVLFEMWEQSVLWADDETVLTKMSDSAVKQKTTHYRSAPSVIICAPRDAAERLNARRTESEKAKKERKEFFDKFGGDPLLSTSQRAKKGKEELFRTRKEALKRNKKERGASSVERSPGAEATAPLVIGGRNATEKKQQQKLRKIKQQQPHSPSSVVPHRKNYDDVTISPVSVVTAAEEPSGCNNGVGSPDATPVFAGVSSALSFDSSFPRSTDEDGIYLCSSGIYARKVDQKRPVLAQSRLEDLVYQSVKGGSDRNLGMGESEDDWLCAPADLTASQSYGGGGGGRVSALDAYKGLCQRRSFRRCSGSSATSTSRSARMANTSRQQSSGNKHIAKGHEIC